MVPTSGTATFSDDCSAALTLTHTDIQTTSTCGQILRQWSVTDGCNPPATAIQVIQVFDPTPPIFNPTPPATALVDCSQTPVLPNVSASDSCGGLSTFILSTSGLVGDGCTESFTRTWLAINACGQSSSTSQIVTSSDETPPILTIPSSRQIECQNPVGTSLDPSSTGPTGTADDFDACSGVDEPTFSDDPFTPGGCSYTVSRHWYAVDDCGNPAVNNGAIQVLTVKDTQNPTFVPASFPPDTTVGCTLSVPVQFPIPTDACQPQASLDVTFHDTNGAAQCPTLIEINRAWIVSDNCQHTYTQTQLIAVTDDQNPLISVSDITIPCSDSFEAPPQLSATVTHVCAGETTQSLTYTDVISDDNCPILVTRSWVVTDTCGDTASTTQLIFRTDNIDPVFDQPLPPADLEILCDDVAPSYTVDGTDSCDPTPTQTYYETAPIKLQSVGSCPANTEYTRNWVLTDNCGNSAIFTQTVTIDNTPPANCTAVTCIPSPCDDSSCPDQSCDCCGQDPLPCTSVNCNASPCSAAACTPVACSGCDIPVTPVTTCQPKVCPPQYIIINDDDAVGDNRGPVANLKKVNNVNPRASGATQLVVSSLLLVAGLFSVFIALF